ncbi:hypothetical protein [Streptomyces cyaneofuscatus]
MKTRIEFTAFLDVLDTDSMTIEQARERVRTALLLGDDKADGEYETFMDDVTFFSPAGDDE